VPRIAGVLDVRVKGAVGVVQMDRPVDATRLRALFVEKGCWLKPFSDIVYLAPPLVIGEDDLSHLTRAIFDILNRG
jgi:adenosylmethionine-8-amino-7-oxononanoate aminotransferase